MTKPPPMYTEDELRQTLKDRQGGLTIQAYAAEIGISLPYLSQILNGTRPISNKIVLNFLAPKGSEFVHKDVWYLMSKSG